MNLQSTIQDLASQFAADILAAIRSAPLEELVGGTSASRTPRTPKGDRLPRRSEEDVAKLVDRICGLLGKAKDGLRAEVLREKLGIEAKELPRPIAQAIKEKRIAKSGNKRATTYKLATAKKSASKPKLKAKKSASKPKAKAKKKAAPKAAPKPTVNGAATP